MPECPYPEQVRASPPLESLWCALCGLEIAKPDLLQWSYRKVPQSLPLSASLASPSD